MFKYFPTLSYDFGATGGIKTVTNLFKDVNIDVDSLEFIKTEQINPGERPEQLSYRLYNSFDYYWILMLLNNIKNPFNWNKILGQQITNKDLDTFDARVLQFGNTSPFLPTKEESGITYNGVLQTLYSDSVIDSYDGVDLSGIQIGDTVIFETGLGPYGIKCIGAGIIPESSVAQGLNRTGEMDDYAHYGQSIVPLEFDFQKDSTQLTAGKDFTCVLDKYGQIHCWGREDTLVLFNCPACTDFTTITPNYIKSVRTLYKFIEASQQKLVAINSDSRLEFYGNYTTEPALYAAAGSTVGIKTSWYHVSDSGSPGGVILKSDKTLVDCGTLANTGITYDDVSCGSQFCVGIISKNGRLIAWGENAYGQLEVPSGTGFVEVSATHRHALARKSDGTVYAWGLTADGQTIVPDKKYKAIAAGKRHSAALTVNDELFCWGKIPRAGFTGANVAGITSSGYTLSNYTTYGSYDRIYSGDHHIVLRGLTGTYQKFIGKVEEIDDGFKRLICKYYGGVLSNTDLIIDDPTGTVVTILRNGQEIKQIKNCLVGIQDIKNTTVEIQINYEIIPITKDIWKTVFINNFSNAENDSRFMTLNKKYRDYSYQLKQNMLYVNTVILQKIDSRISEDLQSGNVTSYKLSDFNI